MDEEEDNKYRDYANLPIPTYEEATSSRPTSSQDFRGAQEVSDDAERQGLLHTIGDNGHRQPTVESARSSEDSDLQLPEVAEDDARRHIEELDYLDPAAESSQRQRGIYHRARLRGRLSKYIANLSSLRLPSFRSLYAPVSTQDANAESQDTTARPRSRWFPPLLTQISIPEEYRMTGPNIARICALFMLGTIVYVLFAFDMFPARRRLGGHFDPEAVRQFVQESITSDGIAQYLHHITSYDHVAGTEGDFYLAKWMQEMWIEEGWFDEVSLQSYYVYLNYPTKHGRSVKILKPEGKKWAAKLEENQVDREKEQTWAWHGHSKNGNVTGPLVYANSGNRDDFAWLKANNVQLEGAIALVKRYGSQSSLGLKIKAAEDAGCAGVLVYSDPIDDGAGKGRWWPDGPWRPPDSVDRGSVSYGNLLVGDPLTPGWASRKKHDQTNPGGNHALPQIPSLPLAWRDAKVLIEAINGQGVKVPHGWVGGANNQAEWFSGGGDGVTVELKNNNDISNNQQIWNLHGLIQGIESPEKRVIVGSHRDSWCFGAVDPGSGSAIMMEVVSIFMALMKMGWRPLRTLEFASWDAGAYNSIGSSEFVEDNVGYLRDHGIAYLNVDAGVFGQDFHAAGSPLLKKALLHVLNRVSDSATNETLRELWQSAGSELDGLGAGSDYVGFQHLAGTSSIDFSFRGKPHALPQHSCYETFEWMRKFGDNNFSYHRILAQVMALMILEIADRPLIPFDLAGYVQSIEGHVEKLHQDAQATFSRLNQGAAPKQLAELGFDLTALRNAAGNLTQSAQAFHRFEDVWTSNVLGAGGLESASFSIQRLRYNDKISHFETDLLDLAYLNADTGFHGLPGRNQFKHVVYAPELWYDGVSVFPAIREAMEEGDWKSAQRMVVRVASVLDRAGRRLLD